MNPKIQEVTDRIRERSRPGREAYLARVREAGRDGVNRAALGCGNLAHGFAGLELDAKTRMRSLTHSSIAIVSAYNDVLSAHQPYQHFPALIREAVQETGGVAQFAGGVPAMCDGVTQGQPGMDLSLMSRDVIAQAAAIALCHNLYDGALMLGICDKIVPGLLIAALTFGHLPVVFVPGGPMPSGLPNKEKAKARKLYAEGKIGKDGLLEAEAQSYHSPGTCTFYGTANSNQLMLELMGLQLPGSSFVNPYTPLRDALTRAAARQITRLTRQSGNYLPIGELVDERVIVNALVGLLVSGGSTNHTLHWVAVARAAGITITWDDFSDLSRQVPLLCRIYPNGPLDVNHFHEAGGMAFLSRQLLEHELLHGDAITVAGGSLAEKYVLEPVLEDGRLDWREGTRETRNPEVLRPLPEAFRAEGGLLVVKGGLGSAIVKTSSLTPEQLRVEAPAAVFRDQHELQKAFSAGELNRDCVVVVPFQGPKACGMPELHRLTPPLSVLQDRGYRVALVTDGRMSGASGDVPAALHLCPEACDGGAIALVRDGDPIRLDVEAGTLELLVSEEELAARRADMPDLGSQHRGYGRELFGNMRRSLGPATEGACSLFD